MLNIAYIHVNIVLFFPLEGTSRKGLPLQAEIARPHPQGHVVHRPLDHHLRPLLRTPQRPRLRPNSPPLLSTNSPNPKVGTLCLYFHLHEIKIYVTEYFHLHNAYIVHRILRHRIIGMERWGNWKKISKIKEYPFGKAWKFIHPIIQGIYYRFKANESFFVHKLMNDFYHFISTRFMC